MSYDDFFSCNAPKFHSFASLNTLLLIFFHRIFVIIALEWRRSDEHNGSVFAAYYYYICCVVFLRLSIWHISCSYYYLCRRGQQRKGKIIPTRMWWMRDESEHINVSLWYDTATMATNQSRHQTHKTQKWLKRVQGTWQIHEYQIPWKPDASKPGKLCATHDPQFHFESINEGANLLQSTTPFHIHGWRKNVVRNSSWQNNTVRYFLWKISKILNLPLFGVPVLSVAANLAGVSAC